MNGSDFLFDFVAALHYKCHNVGLNRDGSYIDSPKWIIDKITIYPQNSDEKCVQYAVTVVLYHKKLENIQKKYQCNRKYINLPTGSKDWKKFETNKAYISKSGSQCKHQVILLMISEFS